METLFQHLGDFIREHRIWAGVVLGIVTMVESLVLVGAFIPATALLVLAGSLIAAGVLDPFSVIAGCVIGAVIGDAISFAIGRHLGARTLRHPWLSGHRRKIARTRLYCQRYGVVSVYVGRFFGPIRAFVPVVLGMLRMPPRTFQIANVCSAFVWILAVLAPGYFATLGLARLEVLFEADAITLAIVVTGLMCVAGIALRYILRARARHIATFETTDAQRLRG
jgi:membrane protein DedA with SNARE-associated domain